VLPSVIAYPPGQPPLVGFEALSRWRIDPENTIASIKRIVGRRWYDQEMVDYREHCGFQLERGEGHQPLVVCRGGRLTPTQVASELLRRIRDLLNPSLEGPTTICVPPSFSADSRMELAEAAESAGFHRVLTIDEPYAAALPSLGENKKARTLFVYDLGGGTFDVAILRVQGFTHQILSMAGDPYLGGDDLDLGLATILRERVLETQRWDLKARPESWRALIGVCRQAKVRLAKLPRTRVALGLVDPVVADFEQDLTRQDLDLGLHDLLQRSFAICDESLREAGLRVEDIDEVVLSGGSTYLPTLQERVGRYFKRSCVPTIAPDEVVARGAAIAAGRRR